MRVHSCIQAAWAMCCRRVIPILILVLVSCGYQGQARPPGTPPTDLELECVTPHSGAVLFVCDVILKAHGPPPWIQGPKPSLTVRYDEWDVTWCPPLASLWGDPEFPIPGFVTVDGQPLRGDVIAQRSTISDGCNARGHLGIVVSENEFMHVGRSGVVEKIPIPDQLVESPAGPITVRRFVGY